MLNIYLKLFFRKSSIFLENGKKTFLGSMNIFEGDGVSDDKNEGNLFYEK